MKLYINGECRAVEEVKNLKSLLDHLKVNALSVVVEHNKSLVPRKVLDDTLLNEGDHVEIVHFVGGGGEEIAAKDGAENKEKRKRPVKTKPEKKSRAAADGPANLVIVESPAKAKTINKFLGKDYQVEASMGHVRDLPKSKMGVDIQQNFNPQYIIISRARKTVTHLKKQAKGKKRIFLAPDPDREGEAISWHLAHIFQESTNGNAEVKRVVFNEITKEAVQEAFRNPREIAMNLVNAQQARRILDRIVGYELSPLLWRKVGRGLSAGRVQSVALRMIAEREQEIRKFVPLEYWTLEAKLSSEKEEKAAVFIARLDKIGEEKAELKNQAQTDKLRQEIQGQPFKVHKIESKERTRKPQAPLTTSKLQQEAYNRLRFSAAKTMRVAQKLYEGVELGSEGSIGLITYMRTDSVNVASSAQQEAAHFIRGKYGNDYLPETPPVYRSKKGAQEAHEAIRPTSVQREPESIRSFLSDEEYKLYDLIWRKFLASQMKPAVDLSISVSILNGDKYWFKATGRRNIFPGFGILYDLKPAAKETAESEKEKDEDPEGAGEDFSELPNLTEGETLRLHSLDGYQHFTKPPARYNDASLVKTLEEKGIGRPSTYAPTIYTLLYRDYVQRKGGAIMPTELGEMIVGLLVEHFPKVLDVQFTANMEEELDKIEEGASDWVSVLQDFYRPFEIDIAAARETMKNLRQEVVPTEYVCDICGKVMVMRWGRFGKFLACSGYPDCKYTRSIPTGYRCPQPDCGGDLVKRTSKKKKTFYGCSRYPKCTYLAYKLPEQSGPPEDEKLSDIDNTSPEP